MFRVIEKTLTVKVAQKQKSAPYNRSLLKKGRGNDSKPIPENSILVSNFPKNETSGAYKLGIGDTLTFSRLIENKQSSKNAKAKWPKQQGRSKYELGVGDSLSLTLIKELKPDPQMVPAGENINYFFS